MRDWYRHDWDRQKVIELFAVIDWMMRLPKAQDEVFWKSIEEIEEEAKMRYVTSIERLGLKRGIEQGIQQGLQQGQARLLERLLVQRFGELPPWVGDKLASATEAELQTWAGAVLAAPMLAAVFDAGHH